MTTLGVLRAQLLANVRAAGADVNRCQSMPGGRERRVNGGAGGIGRRRPITTTTSERRTRCRRIGAERRHSAAVRRVPLARPAAIRCMLDAQGERVAGRPTAAAGERPAEARGQCVASLSQQLRPPTPPLPTTTRLASLALFCRMAPG
uniref:Uncharacterized protein n=1 Tax=Plectus sambesii TaxID=2011161 RepID=A0A914XG21_9BILA